MNRARHSRLPVTAYVAAPPASGRGPASSVTPTLRGEGGRLHGQLPTSRGSAPGPHARSESSAIRMPRDAPIPLELIGVVRDVALEFERTHGRCRVVMSLERYQDSRHLHSHALIASTALSEGAVLATGNIRHYERIDGLQDRCNPMLKKPEAGKGSRLRL